MKGISNKNNGFGIVEAVIALAILAIAVAALMQTTSVMFDAISNDNRITRDNTFCENVFNDIGVVYDSTFDTYESATVDTNSSEFPTLIVDGVELTDENKTNFNEGIFSVPSISNNLEVHTVSTIGTQYEFLIKNPFLNGLQTSVLDDGNYIYILEEDESFLDYNEFIEPNSRDKLFTTIPEQYSGLVVDDANTSYVVSNSELELTYNYCDDTYTVVDTIVENALVVHFDQLEVYPSKTPFTKSPTLNGVIIDNNDVGTYTLTWDRICFAVNNCSSDNERDCADNDAPILTEEEEIMEEGDLYFLLYLNESIPSIDNGDPISFTYLETLEVDGFREVKSYEDEFPDEGSDLIKLDGAYESDLNSDLASPFLDYANNWRTLAEENLRHNDVDIIIGCEETNDDGACDSSSRVASCQVNNTDGSHMKFSKVYRKAL